MGRKKAPFYHIVIADSRSPRDGKFIEHIGSYNPTTVPATIDLKKDRALHWLEKGAQPTDTLHRILSYKGILYHKHLLRGVKKGVLTQEMADKKWLDWENKHQSDVMDVKATSDSVKKKGKKKSVPAVTVDAEVPAAEIAPEVVAEAPTPEAPAAEETPAAE